MNTPIIIFGEVLFDHFPDGQAVLGGAPFNVAWHLRGLGADPLLVSRVGNDPQGEQVAEAMDAWGLDRRGLQWEPAAPTGRVDIELENGQPTYAIRPDQAYDHIDANQLPQDAGIGWLYHGTLAGRSESSREALRRLRGGSGIRIFVDLNLRAPWWTPDWLVETLNGASWLKLNGDELAELAAAVPLAAGTPEAQVSELRRRFELTGIIVTRGEAGATVTAADGTVHQAKPGPMTLVDAVGAGDAFAATCLLGLAEGWPYALMVERAQALASAICGIRGATTPDETLYRNVRAAWDAGGA